MVPSAVRDTCPFPTGESTAPVNLGYCIRSCPRRLQILALFHRSWACPYFVPPPPPRIIDPQGCMDLGYLLHRDSITIRIHLLIDIGHPDPNDRYRPHKGIDQLY